MFCGIVSGYGEVKAVDRLPSFCSICIEMPTNLREGIEIGASIAIDGVCLTVTKVNNDGVVSFDVINETLCVTTLNKLKVGYFVNVERSLRAHTEVGGHIVSGHVDGLATICAIDRTNENCTVVFSVSPKWTKYIFPKGFIALNGISLTVGFVDRLNNKFSVYLIPETLRRTTFNMKKEGDSLNFEIDRQTQTIVDTMNIFLERLEQKLLAASKVSPINLSQETKGNLLSDLPSAISALTEES